MRVVRLFIAFCWLWGCRRENEGDLSRAEGACHSGVELSPRGRRRDPRGAVRHGGGGEGRGPLPDAHRPESSDHLLPDPKRNAVKVKGTERGRPRAHEHFLFPYDLCA